MIIILAALDAEISGVFHRMEVHRRSKWGVSDIREGRLRGHRIVAAKTGVGKSCAAATSAHLLTRFPASALIYIGTAGALDPGLDIGDFVVSTETVQHDLDATRFGFKRGEIPFEGIRFFPSAPRLVEVAERFRPPDGARLVRGRILTGDQFCDERGRAERPYLTGELEGVAVEMEGAAAGAAAHLAGVDFLLLRIISDRADGSAVGDFSSFLDRAAGGLADFADFLLDSLPPETRDP